MKYKKQNSRGFSHVELLGLIVVVIAVAIVGVKVLDRSHADSITTASTPSNCTNNSYATVMTSVFSRQSLTTFSGTSAPSGFVNFGTAKTGTGGYVEKSHATFPGGYMRLLATPDSSVGPGIVGTSVGFNGTNQLVGSAGGFDVCLQMSPANWNHLELSAISWPSDSNFNNGEVDLLDAQPTLTPLRLIGLIHEIGTDPQYVEDVHVYPNSLLTGPHLLSVRWDKNGYYFYLDGTAGQNYTYQAPKTNHELDFLLQDPNATAGTNTAAVDVYWVASYI